MDRPLNELEEIVRERVCRVCSDRTTDGSCSREDVSTCSLFRLFPQVARAIQNTDSDDIRDYIEAIRRDVCSVCHDLAPDGTCASRLQVRCSLDAYLLLVVDAIEEATGKGFDRELLETPAAGKTLYPAVAPAQKLESR